MSSEKEKILGIDPGLAITGWGVIDVRRSPFKVLDYGVIRTSSGTALTQRLVTVYNEVGQLIEKFAPQKVAVEQLYFGQNSKTAMTVGQARGVTLLAACHNTAMIEEYTPLQVKSAVCGYGRANKKQVQQMVKNLLKLKEIPKPDDAADALAVAYTAAVTNSRLKGLE